MTSSKSSSISTRSRRWALASVTVRSRATASVVFGFTRFIGRHLWTASADDADRFLVHQRKTLRLTRTTVQHKALALARFYDFVLARYQGDIHAITGHVVVQPIDEFNRPAKADYGAPRRIPPCDEEVEEFFTAWRDWLPTARKYLPAAPRTTWLLPCGVGPAFASARR